MKRIDAHMHVCQWISTDGRTAFENLRDYQRENEIEAVDIMACSNENNLWSGYELDQNIIAAITKLEVPSTYIHGCMVIPRVPEKAHFVEQLEELYAMGFDGVKCCEYKPDSYKVHQMDEREADFEQYFDWCEKHGFPMCWHVADPDTFWHWDTMPQWAKEANWFYGDGTFPTYESLYEKTYAVLDRHPNLHVMLAHAYFLSGQPDQVRALLRKYPRVTLDLAPGWEMFEGFRIHRDEWADIFRTYSDRILYATDADMVSGTQATGKLARDVYRFLTTTDEFTTNGDYHTRGIALEDEHLEKILYTNTKRIVGDRPREIDKSVLREYIKRMLPVLPDTKNRQMIEEYLRKRL